MEHTEPSSQNQAEMPASPVLGKTKLGSTAKQQAQQQIYSPVLMHASDAAAFSSAITHLPGTQNLPHSYGLDYQSPALLALKPSNISQASLAGLLPENFHGVQRASPPSPAAGVKAVECKPAPQALVSAAAASQQPNQVTAASTGKPAAQLPMASLDFQLLLEAFQQPLNFGSTKQHGGNILHCYDMSQQNFHTINTITQHADQHQKEPLSTAGHGSSGANLQDEAEHALLWLNSIQAEQQRMHSYLSQKDIPHREEVIGYQQELANLAAALPTPTAKELAVLGTLKPFRSTYRSTYVSNAHQPSSHPKQQSLGQVFQVEHLRTSSSEIFRRSKPLASSLPDGLINLATQSTKCDIPGAPSSSIIPKLDAGHSSHQQHHSKATDRFNRSGASPARESASPPTVVDCAVLPGRPMHSGRIVSGTPVPEPQNGACKATAPVCSNKRARSEEPASVVPIARMLPATSNPDMQSASLQIRNQTSQQAPKSLPHPYKETSLQQLQPVSDTSWQPSSGQQVAQQIQTAQQEHNQAVANTLQPAGMLETPVDSATGKLQQPDQQRTVPTLDTLPILANLSCFEQLDLKAFLDSTASASAGT